MQLNRHDPRKKKAGNDAQRGEPYDTALRPVFEGVSNINSWGVEELPI